MLLNVDPILISEIDIIMNNNNNNMNFALNLSPHSNSNVVVVDGDNNNTYIGGKDSEECIRSRPRTSIVSLNQDEGSKPLGVSFTPGPFDGEYPKTMGGLFFAR